MTTFSSLQITTALATSTTMTPRRTTTTHSFIIKRFLLLLASTLVVAHLHIALNQQAATAEAKPLNVNQVKFRRLPPKEFSAALGSSITIECEAGGSPPPTIYWLKNGKRIVQNELDENLVIDPASGLAGKSILVDDINRIALSATRSRLFIDCASIADEATYTCVADNEYSQVSTHTKLSIIMPQVSLRGVSSSLGNENDLSSANDVASLSELAVAAAAAAAASGSLKSTMDSNNGNTDEAAVAAAAAAATAALTAMPQCLSERSRPQPARIHMWTHNIVEIMSNNVLLYCRSNIKQQLQQEQQASLEALKQDSLDGGVSGSSTNMPSNRRFSVSWTTPDGKLIDESQKDKFEMLETGDLLIKNLVWADMGSYVCTVSDEQSSDTISSFVYPAQVRANTTTNKGQQQAAATTTTTTTQQQHKSYS